MAFPDSLEPLLSPRAYPHPVQAVQLVETHISWILLTGEFAYKIKRPVHFPFVDLRSAEHRAYLCGQEVLLNRRFAPEIYVGVCRITSDGGTARLDGSGPVIEHAVKMRQFERADELDSLLNAGAIEPGELEAFGRDLAQIHSTLPRVHSNDAWGQPQSVRAALIRNFDECQAAASVFGDDAGLSALRPGFESKIEAALPWMAERRAAGRIRECHGDLHCSNIVRRGGRLLAFDCLEFEPAFRWIDVADEIAFLLADLESFGRPDHAHAFRGGYLAQSGDYGACRFLELYKAYRSLVRAKVVALSIADRNDRAAVAAARDHYNTHIRCAQGSLAIKRSMLVLMSGLSGSGKTWLAKQLAPRFGAVHLRSDVERKRLAGLSESDRSHSSVGQGLYSADATRRLQQHLVAAADSILRGGYPVVVDATFSHREDRRRFSDLARGLGVTVCIVHCQAPPEILRTRIIARARRGNDPSEADTAVLEWQQKEYEPVRSDESFIVFEACTTDSDVVTRLTGQIADLQEEGDSSRPSPDTA